MFYSGKPLFSPTPSDMILFGSESTGHNPPLLHIVNMEGRPIALDQENQLTQGLLISTGPMPRDLRESYFAKYSLKKGQHKAIIGVTTDGYTATLLYEAQSDPISALRAICNQGHSIPVPLMLNLVVGAKASSLLNENERDGALRGYAFFSWKYIERAASRKLSLFEVSLVNHLVKKDQFAPGSMMQIGPVDLVEFIWKLGPYLWKNHLDFDGVVRDKACPPEDLLELMFLLNEGAYLYLLATKPAHLQFVNGKISLNHPPETMVWLKFQSLNKVHPPLETLQFLFPNGIPAVVITPAMVEQIHKSVENVRRHGVENYLDRAQKLPPLPQIEVENPRLAAGIAKGLMNEAVQHRHYGVPPKGIGYLLNLPDGYPLRDFGFEQVRIWHHLHGAFGEMIWFRFDLVNGEYIPGFWSPKLEVDETFLKDDAVPALLKLTIIAIWRDLITQEKEAFPPLMEESEEEIEAEPGTPPPSSPTTRRAKPTRSPISVFPRKTKKQKQDRKLRNWGEQGELRRILRERHGVTPHIRLLQSGQKASQAAIQEAELAGFIVPAGYTFVKFHYRGDERRDETGGPVKEPKHIKAKGLLTMTWLLRAYLSNDLIER